MRKVNLREKLGLFDELWSPRIVSELGEMQVKVAKLRGEFQWHLHEAEDELFLVVKGRLRLQFRDGDQVLEEGELLVVPRGVEGAVELVSIQFDKLFASGVGLVVIPA